MSVVLHQKKKTGHHKMTGFLKCYEYSRELEYVQSALAVFVINVIPPARADAESPLMKAVSKYNSHELSIIKASVLVPVSVNNDINLNSGAQLSPAEIRKQLLNAFSHLEPRLS